MKYKLLLWDFDGTLADTQELSLRIFNTLAEKHGFLPIEEAHAARSMTTLALLKKHRISPVKLAAIVRDFQDSQRGHMETVRLIPDLLETLTTCRLHGCRLEILSSNARDNILACLGANGAADLFEAVTGYSRLLGKAGPIRRILKTRVVKPGELLYIGDETRDVEAGKNAGVDVAAVTWGFQSEEVLMTQTPTFMLKEPAELLALLGLAAGLGTTRPPRRPETGR